MEKRLPTPAARDWKDAGSPKAFKGQLDRGLQKSLGRVICSMAMADGTYALSPHFVEWMMGFPIGWTDLGHLEIQSSLNALNISVEK